MNVGACLSEESEFAIAGYGVRVLVVDRTKLGIRALLAPVLPPERVAISSPIDEGCASTLVVEPTGKSNPAGHPTFRLTRDGKRGFAGPLDNLLRHLSRGIDEAVAMHCREWLFVHAGVVAWRGYAILIPGRSRTGKSSLVVELVRRGATYYSDEYAVLDDQGYVHPYSRVPMVHDPEGDLQVVTLERSDPPTMTPLPIVMIVSTTYQPQGAWLPEVMCGTRATLPLIENAVLARTQRARTLGLAARLAPQVVTLQGPRPDAVEVAPQILAVVDDAVVARAFAVETGTKALAPYLAAVVRTRYRRMSRREKPDAGRAVPAPYLRFENFLAPDEHRRVLDFALARQVDFQSSQVVNAEGASTVDANFRLSSTLYDLDAIWELFDARLRQLLPYVRRELGIPWFPLGQIERQLTAHQQGGHFGPHSDNGHDPVATRRLTCVYHFHVRPRQFSGGDLHLFGRRLTDGGSEPAETYTPLMPVDNSLVFFGSDTLHAVCPVRCQSEKFEDARFALNIWFHAGDDPLAVHRQSLGRTA